MKFYELEMMEDVIARVEKYYSYGNPFAFNLYFP